MRTTLGHTHHLTHEFLAGFTASDGATIVAAIGAALIAAVRDAGPQMTTAWGTPPLAVPTDVPLSTGYDRSDSDAKRTLLVAAMAADLNAIGTWWRPNR